MSDSTQLCYPRMSMAEASFRWEALKTQPLHAIASEIDVHSASGEFYPLARRRATPDDLSALRSKIINVASEFGYPSSIRGRRLTEFDRAVGPVVYQQMAIMPVDASSSEVWNYINTVLVPDIVLWRYGRFDMVSGKWTISVDRLFDLTRTAIGRLWWRIQLLGEEVSARLGEDEVVQLLERPRIGGYAPLARALGGLHLRYVSDDEAIPRMEIFRDVNKRLLRRMAVQSVYVMSAAQIEQFVDELYQESMAAVVGVATSPRISSAID
ncbi:DUF6339 family protein [Paenarthrobacter nicotinovorans]|uniref:DUF6339 family protein n=1 Tax=Paenarthrobacter nicotinovorans TaxID=29320 RepID=UPI003DA3C946